LGGGTGLDNYFLFLTGEKKKAREKKRGKKEKHVGLDRKVMGYRRIMGLSE